jgi:hypothetical protein
VLVVTQVVSRSGDELKIEVTLHLSGSLMEMEMETAILEATNAVGRCATEEALGRFDTDGSPIRLGETKLTVRGRHPKVYQSPYGKIQLERYVYRASAYKSSTKEHLGAVVITPSGLAAFL